MSYRLLEHTADVGLEVTAATLPELFSEALGGMVEVVTDARKIRPLRELSVELEAEGLDLLLLELLTEALYRFDVYGELFSRARLEIAETGEGWSLSGTMAGEEADPARHPMKVMIKAVTYHQLAVERAGAGWRATVIFDI